MASIEEIYNNYGVIHSADCKICDLSYLDHSKSLKSHKLIIFILFIITALMASVWLS